MNISWGKLWINMTLNWNFYQKYHQNCVLKWINNKTTNVRATNQTTVSAMDMSLLKCMWRMNFAPCRFAEEITFSVYIYESGCKFKFKSGGIFLKTAFIQFSLNMLGSTCLSLFLLYLLHLYILIYTVIWKLQHFWTLILILL